MAWRRYPLRSMVEWPSVEWLSPSPSQLVPVERFDLSINAPYFSCSSMHLRLSESSSDFFLTSSRSTSSYSEVEGLLLLEGGVFSTSVFLADCCLTAMAALQKGFLVRRGTGEGGEGRGCARLRKGCCSLARAGLRSCQQSIIQITMIEEQHESFQKLSREGDGAESSRHSRHSGGLHQPLNHSSTTPHTEIARDPVYRASFGLRERLSSWLFNCFSCGNTEGSYVGAMQQAQKRTPASVGEELRKVLQGRIVKLKVCETSRLRLDPNVMHPFVRVHIVNKNTGSYLLNLEKTEEPVIYHYEELTAYNKIEKRYEATESDLLLPFATALCDFRALGNSRGVWNQKFFINYPAHLLFNPDTLFLFEVLDFNPQALLYRNEEDSFDKGNFYRVAWSFLRPVGIARTHLGRATLELYRYKYDGRAQGSLGKSFIPDVFYDFLWNNHEKYEGSLTVQLTHCPRPKYRFVEEGTVPSHLFEEERHDKKYLERYSMEESQPEAQASKPKISQELLKFYRNRELCEVPKQLIYKLESEQRGCYRLKFIGNYLYAACTTRRHTLLKVYSLQNGQLVANIAAHRGVVYRIQPTANDKLMVTAGSQGLVKIWKTLQDTGEFIDQDEGEQFLVGECLHTAAVYSVATLYQPLQELLYILTCCYDGVIRLWECRPAEKTTTVTKEININDFTRSAGRVYPTACAVAEGAYFVVGDSIGQIRILDFAREKLTVRCLIAAQELKGDAVLSVHVLNKSHLMLQAKDNLIRHYELIGNRLRLHQAYSGATFDSQLANCAVSPDNKYLLSPSETGRPFLWDVFTATQIPLDHLGLGIRGKLVCCDWHPKYNLVAVSGFIDYCPLFIYGNVLSEAEIKMVSAQLQ